MGKLRLRKNEAQVMAMNLPGSQAQGAWRGGVRVGNKVAGSDEDMAQWERAECSWYSQTGDREHPVWVSHSD